MPHDFKKFPELANSQMDFYYFQSPHIQILQDFKATVVKVTDGDTIRVNTSFRNFDFPVRFAQINAPEMNTPQGPDSKSWLENILLGEEVEILINPKNRVGKFGRLLGTIMHNGLNVNEELVRNGRATPFDDRNEGEIPGVDKWLKPLATS